jgi:hypothetical protein
MVITMPLNLISEQVMWCVGKWIVEKVWILNICKIYLHVSHNLDYMYRPEASELILKEN